MPGHFNYQQLCNDLVSYFNTLLVTIEETVKPIALLFGAIVANVWVARENLKNPTDDLSQDESASIHLYTMESDSEPLLDGVLHKTLCDENDRSLKPWSSFLKVFLTALHKLPSYVRTICRGLYGKDFSLKYSIKSKCAWWFVRSWTATIEMLRNYNFLGSIGQQILCSIQCQNIRSYFEIIRQVNPVKGLQIIHLRKRQPSFSLVKPSYGIVSLPTPVTRLSGIVTCNLILFIILTL